MEEYPAPNTALRPWSFYRKCNVRVPSPRKSFSSGRYPKLRSHSPRCNPTDKIPRERARSHIFQRIHPFSPNHRRCPVKPSTNYHLWKQTGYRTASPTTNPLKYQTPKPKPHRSECALDAPSPVKVICSQSQFTSMPFFACSYRSAIPSLLYRHSSLPIFVPAPDCRSSLSCRPLFPNTSCSVHPKSKRLQVC